MKLSPSGKMVITIWLEPELIAQIDEVAAERNESRAQMMLCLAGLALDESPLPSDRDLGKKLVAKSLSRQWGGDRKSADFKARKNNPNNR